MKINIFFEARTRFDSRINSINDKEFFGQIIRRWTNETSIENIISNLGNIRTCIITLEDCSGINSHVFENITQIISMFKTYSNIDNLMVNNPPKFLYDKLKQLKETINEYSYNYPKIKENQIKKIKENFDKHIIGQSYAKKAICRKLISQMIRPTKKPLVLMFYGKPGIGKTETAKYISKSLYKDGVILREQMTMVGGEASSKYFKATTHNEDSFSKHLLDRTSNVILLDEFALAPTFFQTSFFQMFDEGIYSDQNFTVDVRNSIIICTSNLLSLKEMEDNIDNALLSRFDGFIHFRDFTNEDKLKIAKKMIEDFINKKNMKKTYIDTLDKKIILKKVEENLLCLTNVRNIRKYIEDIISDTIMNNILNK